MALDTNNLAPNSTLGHYLILSRVAQGGMGVVYKAFETRLERYVAVKVLRPEFASKPASVQHFLDEARAVAALSHPNIIPIHFIGEEKGSTFFSMSFVQGESFDNWIDSGRYFNEDDAFWFMHQAVSALDFAHKAKIVHLDIKPSNFLINQERNIFLSDFGLAERLSPDRGGEDRRQGYGTPLYVAPEQIVGGETDQRTDIYSLGATLYHMMVKQPPFDGDTVDEILRGHMRRAFPSERAIEAGVPRGWVELLRKMMNRDPMSRYQDYLELYAALEKIRTLNGIPVVEYPSRYIVTIGADKFCERVAEDKKRTSNLIKADCEKMVALATVYEGKAFRPVIGGLQLSFKTPENAVQWALEILKLFASAVPARPDQFRYRIGIHFGPFFGQGDCLYGDILALSMRLQENATPGTLLLTSTVLTAIEDRSWLGVKEMWEEPQEKGAPLRCCEISKTKEGPPPPPKDGRKNTQPVTAVPTKRSSIPENTTPSANPPDSAPALPAEPKAIRSSLVKWLLIASGILVLIVVLGLGVIVWLLSDKLADLGDLFKNLGH